MNFNFSIDGYPVTFLGMLLVSSITSTTTTRFKKQSQLLNEREKLLVEAEKETMRANLLRAVSHDLRTPLTSIIGLADTALNDSPEMTEEKRRELLEGIREDANWLLNMVENLLSVTRIRVGDTHVNTSPEPLEEVVAEAVQRFRKRLPQTKVDVKVPDEFLMVPMDATLIEQVIINLLENAVYHSGTDEPIEFYVEKREAYVAFHIRDYGKGIDPERLKTIFDGAGIEPNASGDSHKGMGIGLTICKTIINAHNGTIEAANRLKGAEFILHYHWKRKKNMTNKQVILIIEDEKNIGNYIETIIISNGYKALRAMNGMSGLSLCTSHHPDLILLDLGLPDIDGSEVLERVRGFSAVPVIVISARTQEAEKVQALDQGADDYITKPFGSEELLARIRTALRHSAQVASSGPRETVYSRDGLVIDFDKRVVTLNGEDIHLTQIEYKLVSLLAKNAGKVLTYDFILKEIWGPYADTDNQILRVNMANIRRKLESNPAEPHYIFTEIGVGYRMKE